MGTLDTRYYSGETIIRIKAGDTLNADNSTITVVDSNGDAVDLSGYDGKLLIKERLIDADSAAILSFDSTGEPAEMVLGNGSYYLVKAAADTDVQAGNYKFCLKVKSGGVEITADEGTAIIDPKGVE